MSSGCNTRSAIAPAVNAMGNITGPAGDDTAAAARRELGFAQSRVAEAKEVPELVERNRLDVDAAGLALRRRRPDEPAVEEDVGFDDVAVGRVDQKTGRAKNAVQLGTIEKA